MKRDDNIKPRTLLKVVANTAGHGFRIGQIVRACQTDYIDDDELAGVRCEDGNDWWWCHWADVELSKPNNTMTDYEIKWGSLLSRTL